MRTEGGRSRERGVLTLTEWTRCVGVTDRPLTEEGRHRKGRGRGREREGEGEGGRSKRRCATSTIDDGRPLPLDCLHPYRTPDIVGTTSRNRNWYHHHYTRTQSQCRWPQFRSFSTPPPSPNPFLYLHHPQWWPIAPNILAGPSRPG